MIGINYSMFFDRPGVIKHVKDGTKSALSKAGAFIRTRARSLIRPRKRAAKPGQPPSSHEGTLRRLIFFGYDTNTESVVVGPKLSKGSNPTVPHLLEFGGVTKHWKSKRPAKYHAFPYMKPALELEKSNLPAAFAGAIKG